MPYTPGPWTINEKWPTEVVSAKGAICETDAGAPESVEEMEANARLIAAAPELLEALKAYQRLDDAHANCKECDGEVMPELCEACFPLAYYARLKRRAAIAKAEGR